MKVNTKLYLIPVFVLLLNLIAEAQNKDYFKTEICTWYHNKPGAISITFDDGSYEQFKYAFPILEEYNIKATFSIVGLWTKEEPSYSAEPGIFDIKKMGWSEVMKLYIKGHEIAAHGYKHEKYDDSLPKKEIVEQMKLIKDLIESKLYSPVYTLHYPYSFTSDKIVEAAREAGFLFSRTYNEANNSISPPNMNRLFSKAILNNETPDANQLQQWITDAQGKWLIIMYHHLFPKNSKEANAWEYHKVKSTYSLHPNTFEKQVQIIHKSNYWVAPLSAIGRYIINRDNTSLKLLRLHNTLKISTKTDIDIVDDNQALTLKVNIPWRKVLVNGSTNDGKFTVKNKHILVDVIPGKTVLIIKL